MYQTVKDAAVRDSDHHSFLFIEYYSTSSSFFLFLILVRLSKVVCEAACSCPEIYWIFTGWNNNWILSASV